MQRMQKNPCQFHKSFFHSYGTRYQILSIAKQIIQSHKGKIWADIELGIGTKIIFIISEIQ